MEGRLAVVAGGAVNAAMPAGRDIASGAGVGFLNRAGRKDALLLDQAAPARSRPYSSAQTREAM